jgi:hypothetical protein
MGDVPRPISRTADRRRFPGVFLSITNAATPMKPLPGSRVAYVTKTSAIGPFVT